MLSYLFMKILESRPRSYDRRMDKISRGRLKEAKEAVAAEVPEGAKVLEIGCGTGELAEMMIARGAMVTGFDISPSMVEIALGRSESEDLKGKMKIRQMGVEGMDEFPGSSFDAVVVTLVLSELSDDERRFAIKQSARVLKPGGVMVVADEVVPRGIFLKFMQALVRLPLIVATYLVSKSSTHPIADLPGELGAAGFEVQKEIRSQGDAFALVVAIRREPQ